MAEYERHYVTIAGSIITPKGESPNGVIAALEDYLETVLDGWLPREWVAIVQPESGPATRDEARSAGALTDDDDYGEDGCS